MKKTFGTLLLIVILLVEIKYQDKITNYIENTINSRNTVLIQSSNEYKKDYSYKFLQVSDDYTPYSYHDLLNIFYNVINNGWSTFTFYCPTEYSECISDIKTISNDETLLTQINNYASPYNSFSNIETLYDDTGEVTLSLKKTYSSSDIEMLNDKINTILNNIITADMTTKDKLLAVHDYIINNTVYDTLKSEGKESPYRSNTAYGALIEGHATCNGYADAYAIILDKLSITNYRISSTTHIWNAILYNDEWLHIDLTWDDPVSTTGDDYLFHKYFLVDNETLKKEDGTLTDHTFDKTIFQEFRD